LQNGLAPLQNAFAALFQSLQWCEARLHGYSSGYGT